MAAPIAVYRHWFLGIAVWLLTALPSPGLAEDLDRVLALAEGGAPGLALRIMDGLQPPLERDAAAWMRWERERIRIYRISENWPALVRRLDPLPPRIPVEFKHWAGTELAHAYLALDSGEQARRALLPLIWDREGTPAARREWRRMLIRSYLLDGTLGDAQRAVLRFQQDYGGDERDDILLRARILLLAGEAGAAADLLAGEAEDPEVGVLHLLAQLRSEAREPRRVMQAGLRQMRGEWVGEELKSRLWAVVAEAAAAADDYPTWVHALENVFADPGGAAFEDNLFEFRAEQLWSAYLAYATLLGNDEQYLIGDDRPWLEAAEAAAGRYPVRSRSLYALLVQRAGDPTVRAAAVEALLASLERHKHGDVLLRRLFLQSPAYEDPRDIPLAVRHRLVDLALAESDIELASRLMAGLQAAPDQADRFHWQLRRARVLVMGNQAGAGAQALLELLEEEPQLSRERLDRLLQVVFDLQTVGEHEAALQVFGAVLQRAGDMQLQREILYWMAESQRARERHAAAAQLYLQSAMLPGVRAMDPWAQTARYQAAVALAAAGLVEDARRLFTELLEVTEDASRRAVLKRELQRLWLVDAEAVAGASAGP